MRIELSLPLPADCGKDETVRPRWKVKLDGEKLNPADNKTGLQMVSIGGWLHLIG